MRKIIWAKPVLATLTGAIAAVALLIADCIQWSSVAALLQAGTEFIIADPQNGVVLPDGTWFWPAKGVGPDCNTCLASILKTNEPWGERKHPRTNILRCVYKPECKRAWEGTKLKKSIFESSQLLPVKGEILNEESERELDWKQFDLNWRKAQLFSSFFGAPEVKSSKPVLTEWVPPVDPTGHQPRLIHRSLSHIRLSYISLILKIRGSANAQAGRFRPGSLSARPTALAASSPLSPRRAQAMGHNSSRPPPA